LHDELSDNPNLEVVNISDIGHISTVVIANLGSGNSITLGEKWMDESVELQENQSGWIIVGPSGIHFFQDATKDSTACLAAIKT